MSHGHGRRRVDVRPVWERRLRRAWREGPGPLLRAVSCVYAAGTDSRRALYDAGLVRPVRTSVPVVSVGGIAAGGAGKTPLAADLARRLALGGRRVAVVTHGYADEMGVHGTLNPDLPVVGSRDRVRAVEAAAWRGADLAVVDSGFQHRRLWRDAEIVAVGAGRSGRRPRRLPAGPYREAWGALSAADAVVVTRREASTERGEAVARWVRGRLPGVAVARCRLEPEGLRPANAAARDDDRAEPAVAVASIMNPDVFLRELRRIGISPSTEWVYPDHGAPGREESAEILAEAGERGVVGTLKDVVKLRARWGERTPLWYMGERLVWEEGGDALFSLLEARVREGSRARGEGSSGPRGPDGGHGGSPGHAGT